jgi:chemotaxis-related protein WspB
MRCLRFRVGDRELAIDLAWVREVCPIVHLHAVPGAPAWLRGLFDYHGSLLPAADLGVLMGSEPIAARMGARLLLLEGPIEDAPGARRAAFGLLVDRVDTPDTLDRSGSWSAQAGLPGLPFLREVTGRPGQPVHLLDAGRLAATHASLLQGSGMLVGGAGGAT